MGIRLCIDKACIGVLRPLCLQLVIGPLTNITKNIFALRMQQLEDSLEWSMDLWTKPMTELSRSKPIHSEGPTIQSTTIAGIPQCIPVLLSQRHKLFTTRVWRNNGIRRGCLLVATRSLALRCRLSHWHGRLAQHHGWKRWKITHNSEQSKLTNLQRKTQNDKRFQGSNKYRKFKLFKHSLHTRHNYRRLNLTSLQQKTQNGKSFDEAAKRHPKFKLFKHSLPSTIRSTLNACFQKLCWKKKSPNSQSGHTHLFVDLVSSFPGWDGLVGKAGVILTHCFVPISQKYISP